ncbi:MAG: sugar ABC transporter permease [Butyrivibrio sp.]|nr:sugar ABC transporter permease [Acetatifactor muris]MCM1558391.1 sugar ABC transporter permease [Butyrivibrio sp.]
MAEKTVKKTALRKSGRTKSYEKRQNRLGYGFMLPWIIGFVIFTLVPFGATIALSFCNVSTNITGYDISFAGWSNYYTAFFRNTEFVPALGAFIAMVVPYTFVIIIVSFFLAYLLNKIQVGKGLMRTIYFLPVIIMSGPVMSQILDQADEAVQMAQGTGSGYEGIFILEMIRSYSPQIARFMGDIFDQLTMILWFTGIPIVLFVSGLQRINISLYEAAKIDMANEWQILWKITIPMIKPTALVATIFTIAQLGTYDTSAIYSLIKTATGNTNGGFGFAATYSWIYCIIVLIIIGLGCLIFKERQPRRRDIW